MTNSIVLGNAAQFGADINLHSGGLIEKGTNIVGSRLSMVSAADVFAAIDPVTGGGQLADNGGPVETIALKNDPINPALNNGDASLLPADDFDLDGDGDISEPLPVDARGQGFPRVAGAGLDLGAFEREAFDISFDYRFDAQGFFEDPARRSVLEFAAGIWEEFLGPNEFTNIPVGTPLFIRDPETGTDRIFDSDVEIDDLLIFVGAQDLGSGALAQGGPSFIGFPESDLGVRFFGADFEPWVGSISFDETSPFFYDSSPGGSTDIPFDKFDFLSVALHEIGHVLGFGRSDAFQDLITTPGYFSGANSRSLNQGIPIPLELDNIHIQDGFTVTDRDADALMWPTIVNGARREPTSLDLVMLSDIGYEIAADFTLPAVDLTKTLFTDQDDTVPVFGSAKIVNSGIVSTLGGNDRLIGHDIYIDLSEADQQEGEVTSGILNSGEIDLGDGSDRVSGTATNGRSFSIGIDNKGAINGGNGNDSFMGSSTISLGIVARPTGIGIRNGDSGTIQGGEGDDFISGVADGIINDFGLDRTGLQNNGVISGGNGNDVISGTGSTSGGGSSEVNGITNNGSIYGCGGDDNVGGNASGSNLDKPIGIINRGKIHGGAGQDSITGTADFTGTGGGSIGLSNIGSISGGCGDDNIGGTSTTNGVGGAFAFSQGINNDGSIIGGHGNDSIHGNGTGTSDGFSFATGIGIENNGKLSSGSGNDSIYGRGLGDSASSADGTGITNRGCINSGIDNDTIQGIGIGVGTPGAFGRGIGISNSASLHSGRGHDSIHGTGMATGTSSTPNEIFAESKGISNTCIIDAGDGNDSIRGTGDVNGCAIGIGIENQVTGLILGGGGDDKIAGSGATWGIHNTGTINSGPGDDIITGAAASNAPSFASGIHNEGIIDTGHGNDVIIATGTPGQDDFSGTGSVSTGLGNDTLTGFGSGRFDGGLGSDTLFFDTGVYQIRGSTITRTGSTASMNVTGFEFLGGVNGGLSAFANGVFSVDASGIGAFV